VARSAEDLWVVDSGGVILRWNGSRWTQAGWPALSSAVDLNAIAGNDSDVWVAASDGSVHHFDGESWEKVPAQQKQPLRARWRASTGKL
jgi:hypothetical protein